MKLTTYNSIDLNTAITIKGATLPVQDNVVVKLFQPVMGSFVFPISTVKQQLKHHETK